MRKLLASSIISCRQSDASLVLRNFHAITLGGIRRRGWSMRSRDSQSPAAHKSLAHPVTMATTEPLGRMAGNHLRRLTLISAEYQALETKLECVGLYRCRREKGDNGLRWTVTAGLQLLVVKLTVRGP